MEAVYNYMAIMLNNLSFFSLEAKLWSNITSG